LIKRIAAILLAAVIALGFAGAVKAASKLLRFGQLLR